MRGDCIHRAATCCSPTAGCRLDELIDRLGGPDRVAEMTGRTARIVRRGNELVYEHRARGVHATAGGDLESVNIG